MLLASSNLEMKGNITFVDLFVQPGSKSLVQPQKTEAAWNNLLFGHNRDLLDRSYRRIVPFQCHRFQSRARRFALLLITFILYLVGNDEHRWEMMGLYPGKINHIITVTWGKYSCFVLLILRNKSREHHRLIVVRRRGRGAIT